MLMARESSIQLSYHIALLFYESKYQTINELRKFKSNGVLSADILWIIGTGSISVYYINDVLLDILEGVFAIILLQI